MKTYWHIPEPCIAFNKYDGQHVRCEWSKKSGWYKFGSRNILLDPTDPIGAAIPLFLEKYGDAVAKVLTDTKELRGASGAIAFCELWGPTSFCGIHTPGEQLTVTLFDVSIHKRGILLPRDFIRLFGHLDIPAVVYEGNFNEQFIEDVRSGKYPVEEGVVAKGGDTQHHLWMAKIKTRQWLERLRERASQDERLVQFLKENVAEQQA